MALHRSGNHIIFYHMDPYRSIMFGCIYFTILDYLVFQGWIGAMLLHPTNIVTPGPNVHSFLGWLVTIILGIP